jgi:hypothetical protein
MKTHPSFSCLFFSCLPVRQACKFARPATVRTGVVGVCLPVRQACLPPGRDNSQNETLPIIHEIF